MVDIARLGYEVETSQVLKGEQALDDLTASTINADAASKRFARTSSATGAAVGGAAQQTANLNRTMTLLGSNSVRQVGLQLSQVAQQASLTGNVFQALSIQAADIGLAFGTIGIAVGAAIAVLGPVAQTLIRNASGVQTLDDALESLSLTVDSVNRPLSVLDLTLEDLITKYGEAAIRVREFALAQAEIEVGRANSRLREQIDILGGVLDGYVSARDAGRDYLNDLARIERDFGVTNEQARALETTLEALRDASTFDEQVEGLEGVLAKLEEYDIALRDIPPDLQSAISELITLQAETAAAEEIARRLQQAYEGVSGAIIDAGALGTLLGGGISTSKLPDIKEESATGRPSRGGARADPFEGNLERLVRSLETERETIERFRAEGLALLEDRRAQELLGEQEHKEALLRLEEEYQERLAAIQGRDYDRRLSETASLFSALQGVAEAGGRGLAKAAATFGAIEATVNAYRAATAALATPGLGVFGRIAAYASVLATGLKGVAAIQAAGGAVGANSTVPGVSAGGQAAETPQRVLLDFNGAPDWVASMFADLTKRIQEGSRSGVIYEVAR